MKVIKQSYDILTPIDEKEIRRHLEFREKNDVTSACENTENLMERIVRYMLSNKGETPLKYFNVSVKLICSSDVVREIRQNRSALYQAEPEEYDNDLGCDIFQGITVIQPSFLHENSEWYEMWYESCAAAEQNYFSMIMSGCSPEDARVVLPTSLKTEVIVTMTIYQWHYFFRQCDQKTTSKQLFELAAALRRELSERIPVVFE